MRGEGNGYVHMRTARDRPLLPLPCHTTAHAQKYPFDALPRATRLRTAGGEQQLSAGAIGAVWWISPVTETRWRFVLFSCVTSER